MDSEVADWLGDLVSERGGLVNSHSHLDIARIMQLPTVRQLAEDYGLDHPVRLGELPLREKIGILDSRLRTDPAYLETLYERVTPYLDELIAAGGRACRTCVTVSTRTGTGALEVLADIKRDYGDRLKLQLAALQLVPVLHNQTEMEYFRGMCAHPDIDLVSCLPQHHPGEVEAYLTEMFDVARVVGKPIEIHVDEYLSPDETETAMAARSAISERERGFTRSISVIHSITLAAKARPERIRVGRLLAEADVTVVTCPRSAVSIGRLDTANYLHNAIAPVRDLVEQGVRVAIGTDNIGDVFLPLSSGDLLTEAEILAETERLYDLPLIADMLTVNGAIALELEK